MPITTPLPLGVPEAPSCPVPRTAAPGVSPAQMMAGLSLCPHAHVGARELVLRARVHKAWSVTHQAELAVVVLVCCWQDGHWAVPWLGNPLGVSRPHGHNDCSDCVCRHNNRCKPAKGAGLPRGRVVLRAVSAQRTPWSPVPSGETEHDVTVGGYEAGDLGTVSL